MRLRHIEVFHAIHSTGSITNAAEYLHVSQPSVSKVLHHAELQLGFELFHRVKGKLVPTSEAGALIEEVNMVYQQITSLKKVARNLRDNLLGHINIAVMPALGLNIIPQAIKTFKERYPGITFNVQTKHYDEVVSSLFEYENNIGLVFNPPSQAGLEEFQLGTGQLACVYPKGKFADSKEKLRLEDLAGEELIGISESGPLGELLQSNLDKNDIHLKSFINSQAYYFAKSLVSYGLGVAVVDEFTANADGPSDVEYKTFTPPMEFAVKALYLENKPLSKVCRDFLTCLGSIYERDSGHTADTRLKLCAAG